MTRGLLARGNAPERETEETTDEARPRPVANEAASSERGAEDPRGRGGDAAAASTPPPSTEDPDG